MDLVALGDIRILLRHFKLFTSNFVVLDNSKLKYDRKHQKLPDMCIIEIFTFWLNLNRLRPGTPQLRPGTPLFLGGSLVNNLLRLDI